MTTKRSGIRPTTPPYWQIELCGEKDNMKYINREDVLHALRWYKLLKYTEKEIKVFYTPKVGGERVEVEIKL